MRSAAEFWNEAREKLGIRAFGYDVKLDCPSCGSKDVFEGNDETVMDLFYCPRCDLCHVVQYEDGRYWMEQMDEPGLEPDDPDFEPDYPLTEVFEQYEEEGRGSN